MDNLPQFTIEEKRQVVYSSLYRFSTETIPLRQRAIYRVVLAALLGSNANAAYRIGRIQENLSLGSENVGIRSEVIQEALDHLVKKGKLNILYFVSAMLIS